MNPKKEYVALEAHRLVALGITMSGQDLIKLLNANGHLTNYGTPYINGGRGVYTLIHATYNNLVTVGRQAEADEVALAYTNSNGKPAYEK